MCGIVGYIGNNESNDIIIKGLHRLEYRGYDSAGMAIIKDSKISVYKTDQKVKELSRIVNESGGSSNIAIGHTRWATHGAPTINNAHPHLDQSGNISIVHNGIIENYKSIKQLLNNQNISVHTDTDTEVLAKFIGYIYKTQGLSIFESVRLALMEVKGTYGVAVICNNEPDKIIAARSGSPLVLGIGEGETILASDASPIIEYTKNIVFLDEGEIVEIRKDSFDVKRINENVAVNKEISHIQFTLDEIEKGGYDHFMIKEINEQSNSIVESLRGRINYSDNTIKLGGIYDWLQEILDAKHYVITACGTSWHAALIGSYMLEELLGIPVKVEYASELRYRPYSINSDTVLFAISQSGETADTLAAIRKAKDMGALTIGLVNVVGSSIARETSCGVYIHAGPEIGVASTKAFTSQLTVFSLIAILLAQRKKINIATDDLIHDLKNLSSKIDEVLQLNDKIFDIASKFYKSDNFIYLGRGYQFPVALEGALKLKEISYIHAEGYPAAEMKHGPIALIDEKMPVVFIVTSKGYDKVVSNIQEVRARGGRIIIVTSVKNEELEEFSDHLIHVPKTHHFLLPIITTIPLQLLAYHIAVLKECNVDQPRNLAKSVTVE
mgnify:CR=1 FL=1